MDAIGLRELRQDASELIRRVEGGEQFEITVAGRPAARLVPTAPARWQSWNAIADLLAGQADPDWEQDRDQIDHSLENPWDQV